jgi:hypothetical protein
VGIGFQQSCHDHTIAPLRAVSNTKAPR